MSETKRQQNNLDGYGYPRRPNSRMRLRGIAVHATQNVLKMLIYLAMSVVGGLLVLGRLGKKYPPLKPESFHPKRILVIRLDLIGDLVLSLIVVHTLKRTYPDAAIDLLAVPSSAKIALNEPDLSEIITYDPNVWRRPKALIQSKNWHDVKVLLSRLRTKHYDLAVSVFGEWAGIVAVLSGAKRCVGFGRESYPGFMTDSVPGYHWKPGDHKHEVDYCLELAQAAGATVTEADRVPRLYVDPQARQEIEQLLDAEAIQLDKLLIACHVSSNNGQSKRWPIPHWATLLDRLIREVGPNPSRQGRPQGSPLPRDEGGMQGGGAQIILTGTPEDLPLIEKVMSRMQEHPINLAGKTSLAQLAALLQRADLLISGDSGPMHIAAAVGTPLIAIHGPTDPALSGPVSPKATVLRSHIWCSPCYNAQSTADCRFYTTQCMKNVTPALVFETVLSKLNDNLPVPGTIPISSNQSET